MTASDLISLAAAVIALVSLLLAFVEARRRANAARADAQAAANDAAIARASAEAARDQADAARTQAEALQDQVELARSHAQTAADEAAAAKATAAAAAGGLIFEIDRALARFDNVHTSLRPGGPGWFPGGRKPTRQEWVPVELYMGTLERVQALVEAGLLDPKVILDLYGYRVANLVADDTIYTRKLVSLAEGWGRFISLWELLDAKSREVKHEPLCWRRPEERAAQEADLVRKRAAAEGDDRR